MCGSACYLFFCIEVQIEGCRQMNLVSELKSCKTAPPPPPNFRATEIFLVATPVQIFTLKQLCFMMLLETRRGFLKP